MTVRVFVALGGNEGNSVEVLQRALADLQQIPKSVVTAASSMYRSAPFGPVAQADFVNAVVEMRTELSPHELLAALQAIEARHGRVRGAVRWGPRVLDLDILLYDEQIIDEPHLVVPHPGIAERNFVLVPLLEIAPDAPIPGRGTVADLAARCTRAGIELLPQRFDPL